jgi:hypothetical protein
MSACSASSAAAAERLPLACDRAAALVSPGHGQGYVSIASINAAFLAQLPDRDVFREGPRWRTCAVVGSETALRAAAAPQGPLIDAAAAVIRVGLPPSDTGPSAVLGRRTTVRVLGPAASDALSSGSALPPSLEPLLSPRAGVVGERRAALLSVALSEAALNATLRFRLAHPGAGIALADPDFLQAALDLHGGSQPSGAFYALLLAAERCERVLLFGFSCGGAAGEPAVKEAERVARALVLGRTARFAFAPQQV